MRKILLALLSATVFGAAHAETPPPRIPIAKFAALPTYRKPVMSPNGKIIAARSVADGKTTLFLLDADKPETTLKAIPLGKATVARVRWAGNSRILLTVQTSKSFGGDYEIAFLRLIAIDIPSGYSKLVDQKSRGIYTGDVLYTDPIGTVSRLLAANPGLPG